MGRGAIPLPPMTPRALVGGLLALGWLAGAPALGRPPAAPAGIWPLFTQSFDLFTVVLLTGSVTAGAYIFRALVEIRPGAILSRSKVASIHDMLRHQRYGELRAFVER